ncbi:MAG: substrate-binding domain-containing protein [Nitrospiraceae bacterium]
MVPLAAKAGQPFVEPSLENTKNGSYPLWRYLYVYVNQAPGKPLSPIVKEFLKYVYSREGQADVLKDGYFPLDGTVTEKQLSVIT